MALRLSLLLLGALVLGTSCTFQVDRVILHNVEVPRATPIARIGPS